MTDLYMVILGCNPANRFIEQHDVFFGIAESIGNLKQEMYNFWPEAGDKLHIDSYRPVRKVENYSIRIIPKQQNTSTAENSLKLYFLNLGGYKPLDMEEYHYKQLVVASSMADAIEKAKKNVFWKHHKESHVDNKYGVDVDDAYLVNDMLPNYIRARYSILIQKLEDTNVEEDYLTIGYLKLSRLS